MIDQNKMHFVAEGNFDGQNMVTDEGKIFFIPENYASKSKLVQGDRLKLYCLDCGKTVFKQICPIERKIGIGLIIETPAGFMAEFDHKKYKILLAAATYYKIKQGDRIQIAVPRYTPASWAALTGIVLPN